MKHFIFLALTTLICSYRSITDPFWGVALYYLWSVLRPQFVWDWALQDYPEMRWSLIAALVTMVATVVRFGHLDQPKVNKNFVPLLLAFGMCILGSYLTARNAEVAAEPGREYAKILVMMMLAALLITHAKHLRVLAFVIFGSLIYIIYTINFMYVFEGRLQVLTTGFCGLDNNGAALMMAMVIPFCYYLFQAEHRWWRWGFLICLLPAAHAVMLTYSRGAMLSSILACAGMVIMQKKHRWKTIGMALVMGFLMLSMAGESVRERFLSIKERDHDESAQSRFGSWAAGMRIAFDNPAFGVGLRNSNGIIYMYGADMEGRTVHNLLIQMAADSGLPCVTIYLLLYFSAMIWAWKGATLVRNHTTSEQRWHHNISLACFWSLGLFLVGSFFLSMETFEPPYLLIVMAATSQKLAEGMTDATPEAEILEAIPEAEAAS
ncbi:MAG: O-antigen ligase family protein [Phycisphaerae bacterium]|nr:O-antigen ligase family protein [Phycisphaerae bacterium]